jgi:hypothetical protein
MNTIVEGPGCVETIMSPSWWGNRRLPFVNGEEIKERELEERMTEKNK